MRLSRSKFGKSPGQRTDLTASRFLSKGLASPPRPAKPCEPPSLAAEAAIATGISPWKSTVYIKEGKRLIGYDNAEGKGYHRHFMNREEEYCFSDIWKLLEDFKKDLTTLRGRNWDEG